MQKGLTAQILERRPLGTAGASGNRIETVALRDGRELVLKQVSPEWDWISRATGDRGRIASMWNGGLFERFPAVIDHAMVDVELEDGAWSVFMRDVSDALVPRGGRLEPAKVRSLVEALAKLHETFWGESFPELCGLEDRYGLLSFETARREEGTRVGELITRSWDAFAEHVPEDIAQIIFRLVERPNLLTEQLRGCTPTLIHGDVRLTNLGFSGDRVILVDWGERTGGAPPAVELASFLIFDGLQLGMAREDVIAHFREASGERLEERALQLALIGGFVQLGSNFGLRIVLGDDEREREAARGDLRWWTRTVATALETWAPS